MKQNKAQSNRICVSVKETLSWNTKWALEARWQAAQVLRVG